MESVRVLWIRLVSTDRLLLSQKPGRASPYNDPYAVAWGGVNNLTQTLATKLAPFGIRVNGVSPGPIPTAVYLASPASSWMTGQTILINGGSCQTG